jgi:Mn2+/Fe2+ NRAMP family transporter
MRATLAYTGARVLLFAAALGLLYLAGARGLLLFALALLISGAASYILLSRMRDRMAGSISRRIDNVRSRLDEGTRAEDDV